MQRAVSFAVVCMLTAIAALVGTATGAAQKPAEPTHEQKIAAKAQHIGIGTDVKVTLADGKKLTGAIIALGPSTMRVFASDGDLLGEQTIAYANIASVKQKGSSKAFWVMLGVGLAIFVPIGICAAAV